MNVVLDLLQSLMTPIMDNYQRTSPIGSTARAQKALSDLHDLPKTIENTDQLMVSRIDYCLFTEMSNIFMLQLQLHLHDIVVEMCFYIESLGSKEI